MKQSKNDLIKIVCQRILEEHEELQSFVAGFGEVKPCHCIGCEAARELLGKEMKMNPTQEPKKI